MILRTGIRWNCVVAISIFFNYANCFKISSPSILLAYNRGLPTNFSVQIIGAKPQECFEWHSANPEIVRVIPIFHSSTCTKNAIISSIANLHERKVTQVSATLKGVKNRQLNIDVITENVAHVELSYLTDELALGSSPSILTLVGKNKHGHTFTSINGLEIRWNVHHNLTRYADSTEILSEVVRISQFDPSEYESPEKDSSWEKRGLFSCSALVEPIQLGSATISASVFFSSKPVLHTQEISLKVVPNWRIHPSPSMYLLPHASVNVKVGKLFNGNLEEINMENFKVQVENSDTISISENFSVISAQQFGSSKIFYQHINKGYPDLAAETHVVKLERIGLRISNGDFQTVEEMKIYEISLDLYDENNNLIYAADNLRFSLSFPTKLFHVIYTSSNGTYAVVQTIAPGTGAIRYEYKGVAIELGNISKEFAVSGSTDVTVCQKLNIFPPQTILPLLSFNRTFYEVPFTVTGGTGEYAWALSNYEVAKIIEHKEKKNFLRLEIYGEADLTVTVTDRKNANFITTAKVSVQLPLDIEMYPTVVEAEVGNVLIIPTALLGYEDKEKMITRKFDDCSEIEPLVEIIDNYTLSYEKDSVVPEYGKGCMSLQFLCKAPGHSRVNIEYTVETGENSTISHKTTTVLACHKPLQPVEPVRVAVLALGTSKEVAFEGGPRKWPLFKDGHYTELEASNPDIVKIHLIKDPVRYNRDLTVFRVTCTAVGENTLLFRIGNRPSATIQHPAKSEASIKFVCAEPHSLHIKLFQKNRQKKEDNENKVKVPFYGEKIFSVDVWVKDDMGRKFSNISSLRVVWDVSDKTLAEPNSSEFDFLTHENAVSGYRKLTRDFKEFKMGGKYGPLTVGAKVAAYRKEVLSKEGIEDYTDFPEISKTIDFNLVSLRDSSSYEQLDGKQEQLTFCEEDSSCKPHQND